LQAAVQLFGHLSPTTRKHHWPVNALIRATRLSLRRSQQPANGKPLASPQHPHAIRAILLAKATTTIFLCARASKPLAHRPSTVSRSISAWQHAGFLAARNSVLFIVLIFACVFLHEFGHILMAGRFGIETPEPLIRMINVIASVAATEARNLNHEVGRLADLPWHSILFRVARH
jgi:Zn-dependent protease